MTDAITVSTLNNQIKSLLEAHYTKLWVKGEVSRVTYHSSGHLYFSLKDENSTISCVMFKGNNKSLKFRLEEGMSVVVLGSISVYAPRGSYQLNLVSIEPEGSGALAIAFKQLKEKLESKGWFEVDLKKSLPKFPKKIALVTSKTGAALQDMLRVANNRYPLVEFILIDTQVQGEVAKQISKNIYLADSLECDIIIVARGGGSIEDLWNFNEEIVAEAIFKAKTPVVSAIGHEIDYMISDFVADVRAATPSNAIELALADKSELLMSIDNQLDMYDSQIENILNKKEVALTHLKEMFRQNSLTQKLENIKDVINNLSLNFEAQISLILQKKENSLKLLEENFKQNNPKNHDKKGFAQIVKDGKVAALESLKKGDKFELINSKTSILAKVQSCS